MTNAEPTVIPRLYTLVVPIAELEAAGDVLQAFDATENAAVLEQFVDERAQRWKDWLWAQTVTPDEQASAHATALLPDGISLGERREVSALCFYRAQRTAERRIRLHELDAPPGILEREDEQLTEWIGHLDTSNGGPVAATRLNRMTATDGSGLVDLNQFVEELVRTWQAYRVGGMDVGLLQALEEEHERLQTLDEFWYIHSQVTFDVDKHAVSFAPTLMLVEFNEPPMFPLVGLRSTSAKAQRNRWPSLTVGPHGGSVYTKTVHDGHPAPAVHKYVVFVRADADNYQSLFVEAIPLVPRE